MIDYQLIMHLPCRCAQIVYSVFIKSQSAYCTKCGSWGKFCKRLFEFIYFFSCVCRFIPKINPGGTKCHSDSQIRWNSGKRVQRKVISLNPLMVFLIRELVNFAKITEIKHNTNSFLLYFISVMFCYVFLPCYRYKFPRGLW